MKIETRLDVGDIGYRMKDNKVESFKVAKIEFWAWNGVSETRYWQDSPSNEDDYIKESDCFTTKESLLASL